MSSVECHSRKYSKSQDCFPKSETLTSISLTRHSVSGDLTRPTPTPDGRSSVQSSPESRASPTPRRESLPPMQHLPNPNDGEPPTLESELGNAISDPKFQEDVDSTCSTPYVSAPSSPGRGPAPGFFFSAPASPMHFVLSSSSVSSDFVSSSADFSSDFEFSARFNCSSSSAAGSMISADELFLNGQIRPMKLSSHLQRPQNLAPLLDLEVEEEEDDDDDDNEGGGGATKEAAQTNREKSDETITRGRELRFRSKSLHRRARSMSPLRNWRSGDGGGRGRCPVALDFTEADPKEAQAEVQADEPPSDTTTPSVSASSSRSNSTSSRSSKRWVFLMDFLHRSKSEGRGHSSKEKLWSSISFSPSQKEKKPCPSVSTPSSPSRKSKQRPASGAWTAKKTVGKRRVPPSPHELHYTANRAQAEEMKKKTYLPYRQGLLGCLGFSSKSYGAMNGFARALNPVSSR